MTPASTLEEAGKSAFAQRPTKLTWASLVIAIVALTGSLWLSIGMGLKACPLCFYQRTFVMSIVAVLAVGLFARVRPLSMLSVLSLPLATAGLGVAVFHVYLERSGQLECPAGLLGFATAPQQSLAILAALFVVLAVDVVMTLRPTNISLRAIFGGLLMGVFLAVAAVKSAPPLPPAPTKPYEMPLDSCRPPFRSL